MAFIVENESSKPSNVQEKVPYETVSILLAPTIGLLAFFPVPAKPVIPAFGSQKGTKPRFLRYYFMAEMWTVSKHEGNGGSIMVIVHSQAPVILVGGAPIEKGILSQALAMGDMVVAADSGALALLDAGRIPDAVIGDFDSLPLARRAEIPADRLHHIPEQDSTDFEKCLTRIAAPLVIAVGFSGARLDHELAVFNTLLRVETPPCVILRGAELAFIAPPSLRLDLPVGSDLSFFPLSPVTITSAGVRWPLKDVRMEPGGQTSTSNIVTGPVSLISDRRAVLVTLPAVSAASVMQALADPDGVPAR
ncbi:MAG: thiamine diphosphokinase [Pseudomonadota bacterium]